MLKTWIIGSAVIAMLGGGVLLAQSRDAKYPRTVSTSLAAMPTHPVYVFVDYNGRFIREGDAVVGLDREIPSGSSWVTDLPPSSKGEIAVNLEWGEVFSGRAYSTFDIIDVQEQDHIDELQGLTIGMAPNGGYLVFWHTRTADGGFGFPIVASGCGTRRRDLDASFARWKDANEELVKRLEDASRRWADSAAAHDLPDCSSPTDE